MNIKVFNKKKEVMLKLLNRIRESGNDITELTDFKNINRDDIIKDETIKKFDEMEKELFEYFDRTKCGWYRRKRIKVYILTFLRYCCKDLGYQFKSSQKEIIEKINNKNFRHTDVYYSIIEIPQ